DMSTQQKAELDKEKRKEEKKEAKRAKRQHYRELNEPPKLTVLEEVGNAVTHGIGAGLAIAGFVLLLLKSDTGLKVMASCFYGISLILMFLMSCLYHSYKSGLAVKRIWRRFDYSSIYLLIGGTFAPMYLVYWENVLGIVLFCVQWALIIAGITIICVFGPGRFRPIHYTLYFVIGCVGGGIVYTLGMIPFVKDTKGMHFIWHIFVMLGAALHWFGMYLYVY
ncbi:MAG: hemolysin III family protein, partial [[Eubacterium] rectale]|nr:hemolysin III family protein [Agathobacter rectalis]